MFRDILNKKNRIISSGQQGYTLLEIVISIMIFAIIAVGLSLPVSNSVSLTVDNKNINISNNLARSYLKDLEAEWSIQANYDAGQLVAVTDIYTNNGAYTVTVTSDDISADSDGLTVLRRINIKYSDSKGRSLTDIYYDYNRPGNL